MNKAARILTNMFSDDRRKMEETIGELSGSADLKEQAQYIDDLLNYAETSGIPMQTTMRKCGGNCLGKEIIELAKEIYRSTSSLEEFLQGLNDKGIGGGNLHVASSKIIAVYKSCYCDIPDKTHSLNPLYCQCSAGWFQRLFSEIFEKPVSVKIVDTITNGAGECTFIIEDSQERGAEER